MYSDESDGKMIYQRLSLLSTPAYLDVYKIRQYHYAYTMKSRMLVRQDVESKRERTKKLNCLSIQEKENTRLIYREKTILGKAEYHNWSPKPSTSTGARPPPRHGGRRGPWGLQATGLMPAALGRWVL